MNMAVIAAIGALALVIVTPPDRRESTRREAVGRRRPRLHPLVVLAPLIAAVALAIRVVHGRPVLFCQDAQRARRASVPTVQVPHHASGANTRLGPSTDTERLTRLGHFLRSTSLDELPSLVMSSVAR